MNTHCRHSLPSPTVAAGQPSRRLPAIPDSGFPNSDFGLRLPRPRQSAFSLVEILVVVALLSVIILGLVAMFQQTQRALLSGGTQVDVLEGGRATAELLARELEQMTPSYTNGLNFYNAPETGNSAITVWPPGRPMSGYLSTYWPFPPNATPIYPPVKQWIYKPDNNPANQEMRTNVLQWFFFVTRYNQQWNAVGYFVDRPDLGVGTLYRINYDLTAGYIPTNAPANSKPMSNAYAVYYALRDFNNSVANVLNFVVPPTNFSRVADGIVHLKLNAYDTNGGFNGLFYKGDSFDYAARATINVTNQGPDTYANYFGFWSNAVPGSLELELGVLETRTLERFRSLTNGINPVPAQAFLSNHAAQVHLFRQRVAIRNVDPTAYQP